MRNPGGYLIIVDPEAPTVEHDTFSCSHCQFIVIVKPKAPPSEAGGWCSVCAKLICSACTDLGRCLTWEKQMELSEAKDRMRRSLGL